MWLATPVRLAGWVAGRVLDRALPVIEGVTLEVLDRLSEQLGVEDSGRRRIYIDAHGHRVVGPRREPTPLN